MGFKNQIPYAPRKRRIFGRGIFDAATQKNGLNCRGGIYAARCSRPGKSTYRVNRTGRIYASPTNLPEMIALPITAYLPAICRERS